MRTAQLVTVTAAGSNGSLALWETGRAAPLFGPVDCFVGRNGVSVEKREGDGCTPAGLYTLGFAFGTEPAAETGLDYRQIAPDSVWVDDPSSPAYNTWAERGALPPGDGGESLWRLRREYRSAVTVGYNTDPVEAGLGSAIFLHCGCGPTSGCIAAEEGAVRRLISLLDKEKRPCILITGR